jgi:hypothetical protein
MAVELGLCDGTYAVLLDSIAELIQEKSDPRLSEKFASA